jgi:hypothetical protein
MDQEVRGFQVETCFGPGGCPNRASAVENMAERLEALLRRKNLRDFWTLPMSETVHAKGMMGDGLDALRATLQRLLPRGAWSWRT